MRTIAAAPEDLPVIVDRRRPRPAGRDHRRRVQSLRAREEERGGVASVLDRVTGAVVLHDRRVPGRRGTIDHVAVTPSGVWVIHAVRYADKRVERRDVGGLLRRDDRLFVGGWDRTRLVDHMDAQVGAVADAIAQVRSGTVVRPVLCLAGGEWPLLTRPFSVRGTVVCWPRALPDLLRRTGPLDRAAIDRLARALAEVLTPA